MTSSGRARAPIAVLLWLAACGGGGPGAPDPCAAVAICSTPPADACAPGSATRALRYPAAGVCAAVAGSPSCDYQPALVDCALGGRVCRDGACVAPPDPCAGVACNTPPQPACETATVRVSFTLPATCTAPGGVPACDYPVAQRDDCAAAGQVCQAGACVAPPQCLASGDCTSPPADGCLTPTRAQRHPNPGTCGEVGGASACLYPPSEDDCGAANQACQAGACVDPCAAPGACAPRSDICASARTLLHYPSTSCSSPGGHLACDYPPVQLTCPAGRVCAGGACVIDPCAIPLDGAGFLAYAAWEEATLSYDLRAVRLDGTCDQPLASGEGDDLEPSWRAAAGRIAWGGTREGNGRLVVMDLADGVQRVLDTGPDLATSPALSPDGATMAFENRAYSADTSDIWSISSTGGAAATLFAASYVVYVRDPNPPYALIPKAIPYLEAGPAWSFDGTQLYFISEDRSTGWPEIWRGPAAGGLQQQVTSGTGSVQFPEKYKLSILGKPALSADGHWLAYARQSSRVGSQSKIVLRDLSTGAERTLSDDGDSEPAFPALGVQGAGRDVIAVRTDRYGLTDLVLLDVATGAVVQRLTDGTRLVGTPAFPR